MWGGDDDDDGDGGRRKESHDKTKTTLLTLLYPPTPTTKIKDKKANTTTTNYPPAIHQLSTLCAWIHGIRLCPATHPLTTPTQPLTAPSDLRRYLCSCPGPNQPTLQHKVPDFTLRRIYAFSLTCKMTTAIAVGRHPAPSC